ncbi:hypothetical protein [Nitrincola nitratireducens]|uniref:Inner membrane protein yqiK n=1 Tax=Nitrincola nitratireducens TaxID=1229521 RepID=W9UUC1_9GAMM|nr:hypothetical protein [Nitrincola nitratireducens]EXJ10808.1 Inner membrane protein yqiK [Nitrincola nitratireducens]
MDLSILMPLLTGAVIFVIAVLGLLALFKAFYVKVNQGWALIINDMSSTPKVYFTGGMVLPVIHKKEGMKISLITLEVDRRGKEGLICADNMRADINVNFYLRVNETAEDVLKVAKAIGVERASDRDAVNELFAAKFSEALKTVGKQIEFVKLFEDRQFFRDKIIETIGNDLNGYVLEDVAIDYLEQTPREALDPNNILDAEGIRKITELTARQNIVTNELERNKQLAITKKDVETREAMLALERQQADAEARQKREIDTIQAREVAETQKIVEEERLRSETARIETDLRLSIQEENKQREIEVAQQNRVRAVAIEEEKVKRARDLEQVAREKEVALQRIEKEKALEIERKNIAAVVRERVAVEKTVAEEEERTKAVRVLSEAERQKDVKVLQATAAAEEDLIMQIKAAEAAETTAKHRGQEINILAQAELESASKTAEAKKKLAEGIEAEEAASGLAQAKVKIANAQALEKEGSAEARVLELKALAEAQGLEQKGLVEARIKTANAEACEKEGLVEARVMEEKLSAEAQGEEQLGLARAKAEKEKGLAEATVIRERFKAEAEGLVEKFNAMNAMTDAAREHEEFRMKLEKDFEQALASIAANKDIAADQAKVLASALGNAKIDIVGGQGDYFDTFAKSLSLGKAIEGVAGKSPNVQALLNKFLSGQLSAGSSAKNSVDS